MLHSKATREFKKGTYIPALRHSFLTPFYDLTMRWAARETTFKSKLIKQIRIQGTFKVLDMGCGTGTLTILIKKQQLTAEVVGMDIDPQILELARSKVARAGFDIALDRGSATEPPYPDDYFDRVVSSMMFHHLTLENKARASRAAFRILKPGGELHVADLGRPQNILMRLVSLVTGRLEENYDNVKGLLPEMFRAVGFERVQETAQIMTLFGTVSLYKGRKPD